MSTPFRILIGYDGLNPAARIIHDLKQAGLQKNVEATVLTVVDAFALPELGYAEMSLPESTVTYMETARQAAVTRIKREVMLARKTAQLAAARLHAAFPHWAIHSEAVADSPAWAIVKKAGEWNADLVVVGSHNQRKMAKFFFGSVAQKVLQEAPCSVRIIHGEPEEAESPIRIVIGADGSHDSELAVDAVAQRVWKKGSAAHLITAVDMRMSTDAASKGSITEKWIRKQDRKEKQWIHRMSDEFGKRLKKSGLVVSTLVKEGDPKQLLVEESQRWGADCIFVGARGLNGVVRFFLGSVSGAVAARAHCSVEIVRPKQKIEQGANKFKKMRKIYAHS